MFLPSERGVKHESKHLDRGDFRNTSVIQEYKLVLQILVQFLYPSFGSHGVLYILKPTDIHGMLRNHNLKP